ncbi:MAG: hydrogenase maturation nickel metallochaperone HypA [Flavobacteriaceae bacterium]|nr:hydrogenase maturation nickel metallochaperone HypA [Deltaproteobacteria bacterium]NNK88423.1 hydrogenase maturation nickel metallochaperone HypA [Flavobacteriaceae bacterium]
MHELSIALGIVRIAENELRKSTASKIDEIELDIGELSGVELNSLEFVWPSAIENTVLEHAKKTVNNIGGRAICLDCGDPFAVKNQFDKCPNCGSILKEITGGKELRVKSLLVS